MLFEGRHTLGYFGYVIRNKWASMAQAVMSQVVECQSCDGVNEIIARGTNFKTIQS